MSSSDGYFYFRFWLDGIRFSCSSISSLTAQYFNGATYSTSNLVNGFQCSSPSQNYFLYNSEADSKRQFQNTWSNSGTIFYTSHSIQFSMVINVAGVSEVSTYRDWIALKVFLSTIDFNYYSSSLYCGCGCYYDYWS